MPVLDGLVPDELATRQRLTREEVASLLTSQALIVDDRRRRPLYFDGRFLAARDLVRDQIYFLTRQADLALAGGVGVVGGLNVSRVDADVVRIEAGQGVTSSGELVILRDQLDINLADIPQLQRLDTNFGLSQVPREATRGRTGLFVLGLRPVEYTANPIAAYPTTLGGDRGVEDGDIVEATAVTLVPFADAASRNELDSRRAELARLIFVDRAPAAAPSSVLPLAMVALDRGQMQWIDQYLVRREVGPERGAVLGLGLAPRASREAFVLHYLHYLHELLATRNGVAGRQFAASEFFRALPPVGQLPMSAINTQTFTQVFFPAHVDVDLSIVPDDELPALLDEALELQPIDLTQAAAELESTSVLVLIPVPRANFPALAATLTARPRTLPPPVPGQVATRLPLQSLRLLVPIQLPPPVLDVGNVVDNAWRSALAQVGAAGLLWYVRRRNLSVRADVIGASVAVAGPNNT